MVLKWTASLVIGACFLPNEKIQVLHSLTVAASIATQYGTTLMSSRLTGIPMDAAMAR